MGCGVGCRRSSDPALLWLWCRPVATAPVRTKDWEPNKAAGVNKKKKKKKKKKKDGTSEKKKINELRTEESREGEECRSRWSPAH